ncbi:MAG: CPBP family intramembrane glutamic endopeptidase [Thermodesulfobacteriota bacterium]
MAAKIIDLKTLALSAAIILAVELGLHWVPWPRSISTLALIGTARVIEGVWLLGLVHWLCPEGMSAIGLQPNSFAAGLKRGLIWSVGFGVLVLLVSIILYVSSGINAFELMQGGPSAAKRGMWLLLLVGGVVSPITEEIVFRGVLYGYLRRWGILAAIIGSTVAFVLAHAIQGAFPLTQVVGGIVFAVAYEKEKNLMVPMVIHMLGNLAIFSVTLF